MATKRSKKRQWTKKRGIKKKRKGASDHHCHPLFFFVAWAAKAKQCTDTDYKKQQAKQVRGKKNRGRMLLARGFVLLLVTDRIQT